MAWYEGGGREGLKKSDTVFEHSLMLYFNDPYDQMKKINYNYFLKK